MKKKEMEKMEGSFRKLKKSLSLYKTESEG